MKIEGHSIIKTGSSKLRTLIVDDVALFRNVLRALLAAHTMIEIVGEAASTAEAIDQVFQLRPDLIFLDIKMPGESGFELLPHLLPTTRVIFVTSSEKYALDALDARAVGYLVKPVSIVRLAETLRRTEDDLTSRIRPNLASAPEAPAGLAVRTNGDLEIIYPEDISHIEASGNYSRVHRLNHPPVLIRRTLKQWKAALPAGFSRINRTLIIHNRAVTRIQMSSREKGILVLRGPKGLLNLGRRSLQNLKRTLGF